MISEKTHNSILIVTSSNKIQSFLSDALPPYTFAPIDTVLTCLDAKRLLLTSEYDIIIINAPLSDERGDALALDLVSRTSSSIILLMGEKNFAELSPMLETNGVVCLSKPINQSLLSSSVRLAAAMRARLKIAERKAQRLENREDELRMVNHAKWVLISNLGMSESDAHKYIEKQAMDMRMPKKEVAANIIKTYEN